MRRDERPMPQPSSRRNLPHDRRLPRDGTLPDGERPDPSSDRRILKALLFSVGLFCLVSAAYAPRASATSPLELYYEVTELSPGNFHYDFTLVLDDFDFTWFPGQRFEWIVFGDIILDTSPLTDFIGEIDDLPVGPFFNYSVTTGQHNGPTLTPVSAAWVPGFVTDYLTWSGTSSAELAPGELLFSCLNGTGELPDLKVANRVFSSPPFVRGDTNQDGNFDVSDVIFLVFALFVPLSQQPACDSSADLNDDGEVDVSDAVAGLGSLFVPGSPPVPPPANRCDVDPTLDGLTCIDFAQCP